VVELEGAGHLSNLEQPEKFSRSIAEFIKPA
jgi:pimeloyl-ACP methyl ester carboxylesterase